MNIEQLIAAVGEIHPEAAEWLRNEGPSLSSWVGDGDNLSLVTVMRWGETPQGSTFWSAIHVKMTAPQEFMREAPDGPAATE